MTARLQIGSGPHGLSLVKFTLTYDGELRSNADYRQKWAIRNHISPQLEVLWRITPTLAEITRTRFAPTKPGYFVWDMHHSVDETKFHDDRPPDASWIDTCAPIDRGGRKFVPLVRETLALRCGLKITFMRKEEPGGVYQGGDMDNRLKTLFDALAAPNADQIVDDPTMPEPIYCLMEDDSMIAGVAIETHRLLSRPNSSKHEVRLVIEVDVRVTNPRVYNYIFLGD
jgi:hypothetical protein